MAIGGNRCRNKVIVWDLETVPDLEAFAAVADLQGKPEHRGSGGHGGQIPQARFPQDRLHRRAYRFALSGGLAGRCHRCSAYRRALRKGLIQSFVDKIAELRPRLITFNGSSFDLPVLRYRAMINRVSAPGLAAVIISTATPTTLSIFAMFSRPSMSVRRLPCTNSVVCLVFEESLTASMGHRWRPTTAPDGSKRWLIIARPMSSTPIALGFATSCSEVLSSAQAYDESENDLIAWIQSRVHEADRRRFPVGANPHPATAPAGSNRSSCGGNEMAEAFG